MTKGTRVIFTNFLKQQLLDFNSELFILSMIPLQNKYMYNTYYIKTLAIRKVPCFIKSF